jgi:hypothetical protein
VLNLQRLPFYSDAHKHSLVASQNLWHVRLSPLHSSPQLFYAAQRSREPFVFRPGPFGFIMSNASASHIEKLLLCLVLFFGFANASLTTPTCGNGLGSRSSSPGRCKVKTEMTHAKKNHDNKSLENKFYFGRLMTAYICTPQNDRRSDVLRHVGEARAVWRLRSKQRKCASPRQGAPPLVFV